MNSCRPPAAGSRTHSSPAKRNVMIPTLKRSASRASGKLTSRCDYIVLWYCITDDMLLTSQSWLHPSDFNSDIVTMSPNNKRTESKTLTTININTCRPMSYQEEGAKVMLSVAIVTGSFAYCDNFHKLQVSEIQCVEASNCWISPSPSMCVIFGHKFQETSLIK